MIRVFARKTKWTPTDRLAFFDEPPLFEPPDLPVMVSVTFTWDIARGRRLLAAWRQRWHRMNKTQFHKARKNWPWIGGPAFNHPGGEFEPGRYIKLGVTITSRGCPKRCDFCLVPQREGPLRELQIKPGHIVQDNNLLACTVKHIETVFEMLTWQPEPIEFKGGLDIDYMRPWHIDLLKKIRLKAIWVACDTQDDIPRLDKAADLLSDFSIEKKRCYVLVGYGGETQDQARARLETIYAKGFLPFAQLYRDTSSKESRGDWRNFCYYWSTPRLYRKTALPPKETE